MTKTVYGQAFISGDSLVQDVILLSDKTQSENTLEIIPNIWEDLQSKSGQYKTNNKGYWYWEVSMTDMENPDVNVKVKVPCPKPDPSLFDFDFEEKETDSDWTKYWKGKMKSTFESPYNSTNGLQSKEIILPGTKYIDQNGNIVELQEIKHTRDNLGDIQNLLFNIY